MGTLLFIRQSRLLKTRKKKASENTVEKGENPANQHYLLFPQCFLLLSKRKIILLAMFNPLPDDKFQTLPN